MAMESQRSHARLTALPTTPVGRPQTRGENNSPPYRTRRGRRNPIHPLRPNGRRSRRSHHFAVSFELKPPLLANPPNRKDNRFDGADSRIRIPMPPSQPPFGI